MSGSRHAAMRELRVQHQGRPYRVLYVFDPRRVAILLLGGDKAGDDRWYQRNVPLADRLYDNYLAEFKKEDDAKTTKFSELRAKMSAEARAEARRLADQDLKRCRCTSCAPPAT